SRPGALYLGNSRCSFRVWAPAAEQVTVEVYTPSPKTLKLERADHGYWVGVLEHTEAGARYKYRIDNRSPLPDPASKSQPDGVHEPSEVVDEEFAWSDSGWHGLPIENYVIYELHVGTFTPEGTFDAAIDYLPYLKGLGITAVEVMPVAQFPGSRNWGYDGVYPYAVQNTYGGPAAFKRFIDAAHALELAVVLDVVYNHLGPEGNYVQQFGPYFTSRYKTPWGDAVNFDGDDGTGVRNFFVQNAIYWIRDLHVDGLRLDAVHAIYDSSERHILADIGAAVHEIGRKTGRIVTVIAESDLNQPHIVTSLREGGYGLDAQWSDDFHHAMHTKLTGERSGYYEDFGSTQDVAEALEHGFVYRGQFSKHRGREHGADPSSLPGSSFVICLQNHDQIGNRMLGERLSQLVPFDDLKLSAASMLLSPYLPLVFMGEEYAESAPFLYFVHHSDPALVEAVRKGRRQEFASFGWGAEVPDPQGESTFESSKLNHSLRNDGASAVLLEWYRTLLDLRRHTPSLSNLSRENTRVERMGSGEVIAMWRMHRAASTLVLMNLNSENETIEIEGASGDWTTMLDSAARRWRGDGSTLQSATGVPDGALKMTLSPKQCVVLHSRESRP
ncbi:MAG TPA: malto-oligosyltrehalose trehalohydrolase, partial [Bryobacteraceae bacterium]|nr:malto-oligosyltrehalose trehalohydrolase [Bryobacteraceae bacterium]